MHKPNTDNKCLSYLNTITANGFIQKISKSTRIQDKSYSLINHIITNNLNNNETVGILINDISDHFLTFVQLNIKSAKQKPKLIEKRNMSDENIQNF